MNKEIKLPQAQLFVGPENTIIDHANTMLQEIFCKNDNCNTCMICTQIRQNQHPNLLWLKPEKQYTLDQLKPVFDAISLSLSEHEHYFFVWQYSGY